MSSLHRLVRRSRPRFWLYLAGPVLVGAAYGASSVADLVSPTTLVLFAYFLLPANLFLYGINDVFDAAIDRENPKKRRREIRYSGDPITAVAVAGSAALGVGLLVVLPPTAVPWVVGFLVLGAAYSAPPLRLKGQPPLDSLSNGLYVLPGAATYAAITGEVPPAPGLLGGWLWTMAMHTYSAVPDIDPDRRGGIRTLATVLGERRALGYCGACWLAAAVAFGALDLRAGVLLLSYPLLLAGTLGAGVAIDRAYWWYPAVNVAVGMVLVAGGLRGIAYG